MTARPDDDQGPRELASSLAARYRELPGVVAVTLAGSRGEGGDPDPASDVDLYVWTTGEVDPGERRRIIEAAGEIERLDLDQSSWGTSDAFVLAGSGLEVDVMFFATAWIEAELDRILVRHEPRLGYSTCFAHTVARSIVLEDPDGWFAGVQRRARAPYPEALAEAIVTYNHGALRGIISALPVQVAKAAGRGDLVSVNHRVAAVLACYFDIVFAANRVLHPGEKRQLAIALARCPRRPDRMAEDVTRLLEAAADPAAVGPALETLLEALDRFLARPG